MTKQDKTDRILKTFKNPFSSNANTFVLPNHSGDHVRSIKRDVPIDNVDLVNKEYVDNAATSHTIASHSDTTATGAELNTLTDNSVANTLHRHSELVASDGSPDPVVSVDANGRTTFVNDITVTGYISTDSSETLFHSTNDPRIYRAGTLGVSYPFDCADAGNLIIQPRTTAYCDIIFATYDGTITSKMVIKNDGKIGIGTETPSFKLHVQQDSNSATTSFHVGTGTYGFNFGNGTGGGFTPVMRMEAQDSNDPNIIISSILPASDTGTVACTWLDSRQSDNTAITTRPLLQISNLGVSKMTISAGGNVGIGTTTPATSAKLEISTTTGALLLSRMTTAQRNSLTAINGMVIYNSTTNAFNFYENGAWVTK